MIDSSTIYGENAPYAPNTVSYHALPSAGSPAPSLHEHTYPHYQNPSSFPPTPYGQFSQQPNYLDRRPSISSIHSKQSHDSPRSGSGEFDEDGFDEEEDDEEDIEDDDDEDDEPKKTKKPKKA